MADKKTDISQIRKYLDGELDTHAMHQLEREAQDDPFLMEAIEGFAEVGVDQQDHLKELGDRLQQRTEKSKQGRVIYWKYYAAAASVLIVFTLAYLLWPAAPRPLQVAQNITSVKAKPPATGHNVAPVDTIVKVEKKKSLLADKSLPVSVSAAASRPVLKPAADTISPAYQYNNLQTSQPVPKADKSLEGLLKKMNGMQVGADGSVTRQGQALTKLRLNGKEYAGGDLAQKTTNLPADVIQKAQRIDDYGDQAYKKTAKDSNRVLKEISIPGLAKLEKKDLSASASAAPQTLQGKVNSADFTVPKKISGVILSELGLPLQGVNVLVDGTQKGTQTDAQGRFSLSTNGQATLNIGYAGFQSKRVEAKADDSLKIALSPNTNSLSEVAVAGYGENKAVKPIKAAHPLAGWDNYNQYLKRAAISVDGKVGTVRLSFTVGADGRLSGFQILKSLNPAADQQAIYLLKNGLPWAANASGVPQTIKLKIHFSK